MSPCLEIYPAKDRLYIGKKGDSQKETEKPRRKTAIVVVLILT
jgi:hypothetical protein